MEQNDTPIDEFSNESAAPVDSESKNNNWFKNIDVSILIAIAALLISTISAFISLKESRIMMDQQRVLSEQQEASVWPYLEATPINTYVSDTSVTYNYTIENKGVGPAIISNVNYRFGDLDIEGWGLGKAMQEKHKNLEIDQLSNQTLDNAVLSPGERHDVIAIQITKSKSDDLNFNKLLNNINYRVDFCYCSIYGKCWQVEEIRNISLSEKCKFRESIR